MMKRRVFGMLLSLCLVLALIPAAAFAEDGEPTITLKVPYTTTVEKGGSEEPMILYHEFRGADPDPEALIRARGLE